MPLSFKFTEAEKYSLLHSLSINDPVKNVPFNLSGIEPHIDDRSILQLNRDEVYFGDIFQKDNRSLLRQNRSKYTLTGPDCLKV